MVLPKVFTEAFSCQTQDILALEAAKFFRVHQLPATIGEWTALRQNLRKMIAKHSGLGIVNHELPLNIEITGEINLEGYKIQKIIFQSQKDFYVTANLYIPEGDEIMPGILGLHGHWAQGKIAQRIQERGHTLAKNGYVFIQIDAFGSGERSIKHGTYEYHGGNLGGSLMAIGKSLMGMQIYDCIRAIDVLCSLDCVDRNKIGITGASGGGNQTMWAAAMDERVKAAVPVVSVGTFESYINNANCVCELLPNGLTFTEESSILALIAPKALKICNCLHDGNRAFSPSEMIRSYTEARKIFQLYDADDKLSYQVFNRPHGYWPEIREAMLGWFDLHLRGIGYGAPRTEKEFKVLEQDKLLVFEKEKRPTKVKSIPEYCREAAAHLKKDFINTKSINRMDKIKELHDIIKLQKLQIVSKCHEYESQSQWLKIVLETENGKLLPLLIRNGNDNVRIVTHPIGKEELQKHEMLEDAMRSNDTIIIADLTGTGEIGKYDTKAVRVPYQNISRSMMWLGKTMIGEWVNDLLLIQSFAKERYPQKTISIAGCCESAVAGLFASVFGEFELMYAYEIPVSYVFNKQAPQCSMAIMLQGIINWGDILLAFALSNSEIKLYNAVKIDGESVGKSELEDFYMQVKKIKNQLD